MEEGELFEEVFVAFQAAVDGVVFDDVVEEVVKVEADFIIEEVDDG